MTDPHRKTTSRRRLLRPAVLAMAVVLAAVTGWFTYRTTFAEAADSGFVTARVTRGDIQETVLASGILKPSRLVAVGARSPAAWVPSRCRLAPRSRRAGWSPRSTGQEIGRASGGERVSQYGEIRGGAEDRK